MTQEHGGEIPAWCPILKVEERLDRIDADVAEIKQLVKFLGMSLRVISVATPLVLGTATFIVLVMR